VTSLGEADEAVCDGLTPWSSALSSSEARAALTVYHGRVPTQGKPSALVKLAGLGNR
jgi:hypothetical protein